MGFHDLGYFSQALLAKHGWRLIRNPSSLVGRVLKACYYPNRDFLNVKKGSKASFIWRSIVWGKEVIEKESRWQIGSGENVNVLKDRWLPKPSTFKVFEPPFLLENFKTWRKMLWNLKLPPKVKLFCWKVCKGWLPTALALSFRGMVVNTTCFRCNNHTETIFHALWGYCWVKDVWVLRGFDYLIDRTWENDIVGFLWRVYNILRTPNFLLFVMIMWQVWNARNGHYHEN
ncbi:hypothetical protein UlMin_016521 [Ulmus minor]